MSWVLKDSWTMTKRNMKRMFRDLESLIMAIALPIILMLMFVYVFGGAIETGRKYVNYVVPGIIITCVGYTSSLIAMSVSKDMQEGLYDRLRTMTVQPISLLFSHVGASFVRNGISTLLVLIVAFLIGFRPSANFFEWLAVIGILIFYLFAFSWLGIFFGLLAKSPETASAFAMVVMFLPYISSAFVPTNTMPKWLAVFAEYQPLTPIIESLRALLLGGTIEVNHGLAVIWLTGIFIVSLFLALWSYKRYK